MSFLRQNRNKTCPELTKSPSHKKISGEHACFRTLLAIMGARRNFRRGGGASPKKGPHHEVKKKKKNNNMYLKSSIQTSSIDYIK